MTHPLPAAAITRPESTAPADRGPGQALTIVETVERVSPVAVAIWPQLTARRARNTARTLKSRAGRSLSHLADPPPSGNSCQALTKSLGFRFG